eukprot:4151168-Ditylum_brightwellii.AAC.1
MPALISNIEMMDLTSNKDSEEVSLLQDNNDNTNACKDEGGMGKGSTTSLTATMIPERKDNFIMERGNALRGSKYVPSTHAVLKDNS